MLHVYLIFYLRPAPSDKRDLNFNYPHKQRRTTRAGTPEICNPKSLQSTTLKPLRFVSAIYKLLKARKNSHFNRITINKNLRAKLFHRITWKVRNRSIYNVAQAACRLI